jgi:threonine aldolase
MDGARLANAAARMGMSLREISSDAGVDVLSFGGTKNGLLAGEAVVFLNPDLGNEFDYARKQNMQLASKMRFVAAQFAEYLKDELWRENALASNAMAALLAEELRGMEHVRVAYPVQVNSVFARLHKDAIAELQKEFYFYTLEESDAPGQPAGWRMVRWMTSFDTTESQVREFAAAIRKAAR